jgi:hypothetical protein
MSTSFASGCPPAARCSCLQAASAAGVQQFVLVTSLGTGKIGWPAGVLNLFGGVLIFKRKAEEALEASGLPYVIVRPGAAPLAGLPGGWLEGCRQAAPWGCGAVALWLPPALLWLLPDLPYYPSLALLFTIFSPSLLVPALVCRRHGAPPG